ncbi:MAG TPA: dehydrogenase, partial [Pirellulales bacterium]
DRYHCYQDAQRDPRGIDRLKGRLYRISYKGTPHSGNIDLGHETDAQLVERLKSPNIYYRETAQRLLAERNSPEARPILEKLVLDSAAPHKARMHGLWALIGAGSLDAEFHSKLLKDDDASIRAWGVRAAGNEASRLGKADPAIESQLASLAGDSSADVQLQVAIAITKIKREQAALTLLTVLSRSGLDPVIPAIVWQNISLFVEQHPDDVIRAVGKSKELLGSPAFAEFMPRLIDRLLGRGNRDVGPIVSLFSLVSQGPHRDVAASRKCLALLSTKVQNREIIGRPLDELKTRIEPMLAQIVATPRGDPLYTDAVLLAATWKDPIAIAAIRKTLAATDQSEGRRVEALRALLAAGDRSALDAVTGIFAEPKRNSVVLRAGILGALGKSEDPRVAEIVLAEYRQLEPELQPKAIELLTQRPEWAKPLLEAIGRQEIPASALNVNQVQRLLASRDKELVALVSAKWGAVRSERNPEREKVVANVRKLIEEKHGDAAAGQLVFKKVCAKCHKIYGEGQDVGPDITSNGRASFDQLLSNVLDPSLVIGAGYQARLVITTDGRSLTGLLAEDSLQRIVLKEQGGKLDTIPRSEVDSITVSKLSLMPEGLEK